MAAMPQTGFHFDEATHLYLLDGKPLTGVTTILGVIAKPALIQWAADMATGHIKTSVELFYNIPFDGYKIPKKDFEIMIGAARTQHAKRKKAAGDVGSFAHKWIEQYANAKIQGTKLPERDPAFGFMTDHFVKWAEDYEVKFLQAELRVYSRKYWYAGTLDLLVEIAGKVYIVDVKTGGGIYPEHFFQMAGYQIAVEEQNVLPKIEGHIVLNIKKTGEFEKREYFNLEQNKEAFLAALTLYRAIESMKP